MCVNIVLVVLLWCFGVWIFVFIGVCSING